MMQNLKWCLIMCLVGVMHCFVTNTPNSYDTIVVGLGAAGVTAASTLAKAGRRVLGLEAQERIGGRVKTIPFGDGIVEVGAEFIQGTKNNRVYEMAIRNNISIIPLELDPQVFMSDGTLGNDAVVREILEFSLELDNSPEGPESFGSFVTRNLMDHIKEKYPEKVNDKDFIVELLNMMEIFNNNNEGSNDWNDVTAQKKYEDLDGHQYMSWHRHGYKTFFELLLNTYNNGSGWPTLDIKLNNEVVLIKWPRNSTDHVEVICKDGDVYTANHVIVTVSLGVLKERYNSLFSPSLSERKVTAIKILSMGLIGKVILSFPQRFWEKNPLFMWRSADKKSYSQEDYWITKLIELSSPTGSNNTITFWTSGDVTKLIETLPEDVVIRKVMELLRRFMGKNMTIPEPTGMIRSAWHSNPFTRGTYSYESIQENKYPNARAILGEPLTDVSGVPKVLFAGEATDITHFATVHGASDSGFREAMRLLPRSKA